MLLFELILKIILFSILFDFENAKLKIKNININIFSFVTLNLICTTKWK